MQANIGRLGFKANPSTTYTLTEEDGSPKVVYTDATGLTVAADNRVTTDGYGFGSAYIYGDAQLRQSGTVIRDRLRVPYAFLNPAIPNEAGTWIRALDLIPPSIRTQIWDMTQFPTTDLAPYIQPWLDDALNLYGTGLVGNGGRGCSIYFDAGQWLFSHLDFRPGVQVIGTSSRYEVQFLQVPTYNDDHFLTILGHLNNSDQSQRRTEVLVVDIGAEANGLLADDGTVLDCWHAQPETFDGSDPDDEVTRTGIIGYRFSGEGASGRGYNSSKRGKNWLHECQFSRNGTAGKDADSGGVYVQGPDSLFNKVYCGSNYGHQLHIKSSETPDISPVELGTTRSDPTVYVSLYLELCTSANISGGNSTGPILIEGGEGDTAANEYGINTWVTVSQVLFSFKEKTFTDHDSGVIKTLPGYVRIKNQKNVRILDCTYHPSYVDDGTDPMTHTVKNRPTAFVDVTGSRSTAYLRLCPPTPTDPMWPAGTPEHNPVGAPAAPYDTFTNKPNQVTVCAVDTTDTTHANLFDSIKFTKVGNGIYGITDTTSQRAGFIGELISTDIGTPVALTNTATVYNLGNVALTPGNWEVSGAIVFVGNGATCTSIEAAISPANNTLPATTAQKYAGEFKSVVTGTGNIGTLQIGPFSLKISANTSEYLNARAAFSAGSMTAFGYIGARRVS